MASADNRTTPIQTALKSNTDEIARGAAKLQKPRRERLRAGPDARCRGRRGSGAGPYPGDHGAGQCGQQPGRGQGEQAGREAGHRDGDGHPQHGFAHLLHADERQHGAVALSGAEQDQSDGGDGQEQPGRAGRG